MYQRTRYCPNSSAFAPRPLSFSPLLGKISQLAATFFLLVIFACVALAQEATIVGTVSDASGAVVPNARVVITNTDKNQSREVTSNDSGQFVAPSLGIGHYSLKAEVSGFKSFEQNDINLQVGDRFRVDVKLEVGNTKESVTVEAEAIAVKSESGEVSDVITGQKMTQLATNGRSVYALATLTAGASSNMADLSAPTSIGGDANVSFNGLRENHNLWMIDGGEASDRGGAGGLDVMPSLDSVAEFRALTSNYSSEFGLSSGGTMTMVVKSGQKDFHASAWEFNRNDALDAGPYFTNARGGKAPELRFNIYGFNVGGPVTLGKVYNKNRERTFFFYNQEWRKQITGGLLNTTVPSAAQLAGDFSGLSKALNVPTASQVSPTIASQLTGAGLTLGGTFAGNKIPSSLFNPNATALLQAGIFPAANSNGGTQFVGGANQPVNLREEILRIDHRFSDKFSIYGHYMKDDVSQTYGTSLWSGDNVPTVGSVLTNPAYHYVVHATYSITPTILNEVSYNQNGNTIDIVPVGLFKRPSSLNIPELFTGNNLNRIPSISLSNYATYDVGNWPWHNKADDYQVRDDLSIVKGSHQLKMGASWALYKKTQDLFGQTQGNFNFNGLYTGNSVADFLLGYANSYTELAVQDHGQWNNVSPAVYVQDNWHVNSRLTLNLGLRWDGIPHTYEASNRGSNFYPSLYNQANAPLFVPGSNGNAICGASSGCAATSPGLGTSPNPVLAGTQFYLNGIGIAGANGIPKGLVQNSWNTFGPRIGFAYDLTGTHKTVLRGGFGTMYERIQGNDMYNGGPNQPFSASVTFNNVGLSSPGAALSTGTNYIAPVTVGNITGLAYSDYKPSASYQYSVGVEHEIAPNSVISVSYVGNQNRHQNDYREINLPNQSTLATLKTLPGGTVPYNLAVPYLGFNSIKLGENAGNSHYNSLQINMHSQIKRDLTLQVAYTLSRAIDPSTGGDLYNVSNPYNRTYDNGPSVLDRTHIGLVNFIYEIPFLRNSQNRLMKTVVGGWEVSGIVTMETGLPLNVTLGGAQGSNGVNNATNRPNISGNVSYPGTIAQFFTTSQFSTPAVGQWGNLTKGAIRGPGRNNWNVSVFKQFKFSESRGSHFELRVESFNTWNHTEYKDVSTSATSSNFGQVTSTWDPRVFQLGGKIVW